MLKIIPGRAALTASVVLAASVAAVLTTEGYSERPGAATSRRNSWTVEHRYAVDMDPEVAAQLQKLIAEIRFDAVTLEDTVEYFRELTGLDIVARWEALSCSGIEKDKEVSLPLLKNITVEAALDEILNSVSG